MKTNISANGAFPPPTDITPNFANPDHVSGGIIPISAVFLTLSTLVLALRVYTKVRILRASYAEDYVIITAWGFSAAWTAACLEMERLGNGRHLWDIPVDDIMMYGRWATASIFLYVPATALPKIAILLSYLRVFPDNKNIRLGTYAVLVITIACTVAVCLALSLQCHPFAKVWDMTMTGRCVRIPQFLANAIFNVVVDLAVLLLPLPYLKAWDVDVRTKIMAGAALATGSLTCIVSALRIYFVARLLHTFDLTRAIVIPSSLGVVETNLSVICGCLMVIQPFLRKHLSFLLCDRPEPVGRPLHFLDDEEPLTVVTLPARSRPNTSAGFGYINSSAGWSWDPPAALDTHGFVGATREDLGVGDEIGWPLRNDLLPAIERTGNIIEEMNAESIRTHQDSRYFAGGI